MITTEANPVTTISKFIIIAKFLKTIIAITIVKLVHFTEFIINFKQIMAADLVNYCNHFSWFNQHEG